MTTFGDLLTAALAEKPSRGKVFWIANSIWKLNLYEQSRAQHHPGLICSQRPILAPGTSKRQAGRRNWGVPFSLNHPEALNGRDHSTFFLQFRKYVPPDAFGRFIGPIHATDLQRLNQALDAECGEHNDAG